MTPALHNLIRFLARLAVEEYLEEIRHGYSALPAEADPNNAISNQDEQVR